MLLGCLYRRIEKNHKHPITVSWFVAVEGVPEQIPTSLLRLFSTNKVWRSLLYLGLSKNGANHGIPIPPKNSFEWRHEDNRLYCTQWPPFSDMDACCYKSGVIIGPQPAGHPSPVAFSVRSISHVFHESKKIRSFLFDFDIF